jgi:2-polyprenyl-6-methoxyphenol hydroxylase-like FAD-dependent oxidoreductase
VTLLGDAAHVTAPNGDGANLAMYDGAALATALAAHPDDVETALSAYQQAMFTRSMKSTNEVAEFYEILQGANEPALHLLAMIGHPEASV